MHVVPDAGHSAREPGISKLLVQVCNILLAPMVLRAVGSFHDLIKGCRQVRRPLKSANT